MGWNLFSILILVSSVHFGAVAFADDSSQSSLSNVALFSRCYQHITQHHLPRTHALRAQVAAGTLGPIDACMQIMKSASLISTGANIGQLQSNTSETRSVLKSFNDLHRSWIGTDRISTIDGGGANLLYDEAEPALYTTRALFSSGNVPYSDVLTNSSGVQALRDPAGVTPQEGTRVVTSQDTRLNNTPYLNTTVNTIQTGQLLGVRTYSEHSDQTAFNLTMIVNADFSPANTTVGSGGEMDPFYLRRNAGAGAIANGDYFIMNSSFMHFQGNDGNISMPRRWSRAVYNDFLCRDVPVIRTTDAEAYVINSTTVPSFRQQTNCMQCHASLDQMAGTIRNMVNIDDNVTAAIIQSVRVWAPNSTYGSPNYSGSNPTGEFLFRSYDGTMNVKAVSGLGDLGRAITATPDYYACAASRYLNFFTGVRVNWADIGDPNTANPDLIAQDPNRAFAIQLGQHLQQSQSLMKLVEEILRSPLYSTNAMRN